MDIENMTIEELRDLKTEVTRELTKREEQLKVKLWNNLEKAVKEFCEITDSVIEIIGKYDTVDINGTEVFDEVGRIVAPDN